ncbi:MAG: hypothetical protein FWC00_06090 [Firmicutes bacterium]|nr:hypothetical protein [Bacillota bacterium]
MNSEEQKLKKEQAKKLLGILPHIDAYCDALSGACEKIALNSYRLYDRDTYDLMQRIIDKVYLSQQLCEIKVCAMEQLGKLGVSSAAVKMFFVEHASYQDIEEQEGISERTLCRRLDQGITSFADRMHRVGVTRAVFDNHALHFEHMQDMYRR